MKVGDLIRLKSPGSGDGRRMGVVLNFDVYHGLESLAPLRQPETLVEVLWNTTKTGWVLKGLVEVICGK